MPAKFTSNKDETIRLFQNPVLEYFSHIHPATPVVVYVPVILYGLWTALGAASVVTVACLFVVGTLMWTLTEYVIHRFAFHLEPKSELGKRIHFLVHDIHHQYPRDSTRLVMPLLVSVPLALLLYWVFAMVFGSNHWAAFSGFLAGYVTYDCIHYATHHMMLTSKVGRFLKEYHMKHHYVDGDTAYGVSNPMWDYVFNTVPAWARQKRHRNGENAPLHKPHN